MKCPKCKIGNIWQQVSVHVACPADYFSLSKKGIRKKCVKIMGVGWDTATWYCNEGCGYYLRLGENK